MHYKKLTIVSDTAIYCVGNKYYAFGPVVREIEFIQDMFESITWIGFESKNKLNDPSMQEITSKKIEVLLLKRVGGKGLLSFLNILFQYPKMFIVILKNVFKADVVHTRSPSHPALIAVFISFFLKKKKWWNKYAGNWNQKKISLSYSFQRSLLKKAAFSKVTINGEWEKQPKHCISFENPCLTANNIKIGKEIVLNKNYEAPFVFTFIGRIEEAKGVDKIVEALKNVRVDKIKKINFIGNGSKLDFYKNEMSFIGDKIMFFGNISNNEVFSILKDTHFFILPSKSEGFPKVISEAICYGAIPIVSNVGSIPQYINSSNGFLWDINSSDKLSDLINNAICSNGLELKRIALKANSLSDKFSFKNYYLKLNELLKKE